MPTIPRYDRAVSPGSLPGAGGMPRAGAAAFNPVQGIEKVGQGLQQAAESGDRVILDQQEEQNKRVATDAFVAASDQARTKRTEFRSLMGRDAAGVTQKADAYLGKVYQGVTKNMNQRQQDLFDARWQNFRMSELGTLSMHEQDQQTKADNAADEAAIYGAAQDMAESYTNPAAVEAARGELEMSVNNIARRNGMDAETRDAMLREKLSKANAATISRMLADDRVEDAATALEKAREAKEIEAAFDASATKIIDDKRDEKAGTDFGEELARGSKTSAQAMDAINAQFPDDSQRAKYARAAFRSWRAIEKSEQREAYLMNMTEAITNVDSMRGDMRGMQEYANSLPRGTADQIKVSDAARRRAEYYLKSGPGVDFETNVEAWGEMLDGITSGQLHTPSDIKEKYSTAFSAGDMKKAVALLDKAQKYTVQDLKNAYLGVLGKETLKSKKDKADFASFQRWMDGNLIQTNKGGDLKHYQEMAVAWFAGGEVKGGRGVLGWFQDYGADVSLKEAILNNDTATWLPNVPADKKAAILAKFNEVADPATGKTYRELWAPYTNGDDELAVRNYYRAWMGMGRVDLRGE